MLRDDGRIERVDRVGICVDRIGDDDVAARSLEDRAEGLVLP